MREYAQRTALRGGNPYSARAYERAADALAVLGEPLAPLVEAKRLKELPGVGAAIADLITSLYRTGTDTRLEKMRSELPEGVLELFRVPGLAADKILKLHKLLRIDSIASLEEAARSDRVKNTKGLGASLQTKILNNIAIAHHGETRLHMHRAAALLERACDEDRAYSGSHSLGVPKQAALLPEAFGQERYLRPSAGGACLAAIAEQVLGRVAISRATSIDAASMLVRLFN